MSCEGITDDLLADCENPTTAGTRKDAWVGNSVELESYDVDPTNKMIVTALNFKSGKILHKISGYDGTVLPNYAMIDSIPKKYDHTVNLKNFDLSPEAKLVLDGVQEGRFFSVTENVDRGVDGKNAFEIWGLDAGLKATVIARDPNNQDTNGAFDITLTTAKNKEPKQARYLWLGSYAATLDYLENLRGFNLLFDDGDNMLFDNDNRVLID